MKKVFILILFATLMSSIVFADSGVAFDNDRIRQDIKERIKRAKEKGSRFNMIGSVSANRASYIIVNGESFRKLNSTKLIGRVGVGKNVKVKGYLKNGEKILTHIIVNKKINNSSKMKDNEKLKFDGETLGVLRGDTSLN